MSDCCSVETTNQRERNLLWIVMILNALMFFVEFIAGWMAESSGLIADSLDMLADAAVYSVSLYAVGRAARHRAQAAMLNGSLQLILGLGVLVDVARRIWLGSQPQAFTMSIISLLALVVNVSCFLLLYKFRQGDINLRASWICSRNDMIANLGVLAAAFLVAWLGAAWPDWVIGAFIAGLIVYSAAYIIRDARTALKTGQTVSSSCCGT